MVWNWDYVFFIDVKLFSDKKWEVVLVKLVVERMWKSFKVELVDKRIENIGLIKCNG